MSPPHTFLISIPKTLHNPQQQIIPTIHLHPAQHQPSTSTPLEYHPSRTSTSNAKCKMNNKFQKPYPTICSQARSKLENRICPFHCSINLCHSFGSQSNHQFLHQMLCTYQESYRQANPPNPLSPYSTNVHPLIHSIKPLIPSPLL